ncbi:hypothetical protein HPB50_019827 [Hyalomma asiaticum]|uniref:Uncharacterized protein n=1 Tax=Hyalomma asiaticum TaxID=266040 RepID=A0ACB7RY42_HYAAI|nr:hypothetical protein HPB50_019827 [Hyalomma asiaticum]
MDSSRPPFSTQSVWTQRSTGLLAAMEHEIRQAERQQRQLAQQKMAGIMAPSHEWRQFSREDSSHAGCWFRYTSFVLGVVVVASSALFTAPVVFLARIGSCQRGCFSLEHDLKAHVCSGWDSKQDHHFTPLDKYNTAFARSVVKAMLLEKIPALSRKAKGKAARFMLRCLGQFHHRSISSLKEFLVDLGLPWPHRSPATRPQLLDIIVRASLHFGIPLFWAFYIGRHPQRPLENTIYMTLDENFKHWAHQVHALVARGKESEYLRRGAEIIGGEGQSYSFMIQHVLQAHTDIYKLVMRFAGTRVMPQFYNLTDSDIRRALNGYLPDDSQFWPEDEILNLQPSFFTNLDGTYLSLGANQERFKLFLGAYAVWLLSPIASDYLTSSLLDDLGQTKAEASYRYFKCFEALESIMPLVRFQLHRAAHDDIDRVRNIAHLSMRSFSKCLGSYGESVQKHASTVLSQLGLNAFNMTITWRMLDGTYAYLRSGRKVPSFFDLYRKAAMATASYFARSLRRPGNSIFHVPGISTIQQYRLLVNREVVMKYFLTTSPLYGTWEPATVLSALFATLMSMQLASYIRFVMYYSNRFQRYPLEELGPDANQLYNDVDRMMVLTRTSLPNASIHEVREVYDLSFAAHAASYIPKMPEWQRSSANGRRSTSLEKDRLFFYLVCFSQCGTVNRERLRKMAACNVALPAVPLFRKAFKCHPRHPLVMNFTWPEPPMTAITGPS